MKAFPKPDSHIASMRTRICLTINNFVEISGLNHSIGCLVLVLLPTPDV